MIQKTIQNIVLFSVIPWIALLTFYIGIRFKFPLTTLNVVDVLLVVFLISAVMLYAEISKIRKNIKYKNLSLKKKELMSIPPQSYIKKREIIGKNKMHTDAASVDVFNEENQPVFHYSDQNRFVEIKKNFSSIKISTADIEFLILEYDQTYRNTLKGWLTRGGLDKIQSIGIISAKLTSGKTIRFFEINFEKTFSAHLLDNITKEEEEDFNYFYVGLKAIKILSHKIKKEYLVINYKDKEPAHI